MRLLSLVRANRLALLLTVAGAIGFAASFVLTVDKFRLLQDPSYIPSCNLNPIISCGSVMQSQQASLFGFTNSLIGVAAFAALAAVGAALLAGARLQKWFWQLIQLAAVLGLVFAHWLIYQSLYVLGTLCPYCTVVWLATIASFLYVTLSNLRHGRIPGAAAASRPVRWAVRHHLDLLFAWYLAIALLVLVRFWYYWKTLL